MKKFMLGFILGIFGFLFFVDLVDVTYDIMVVRNLPMDNGWDSKIYNQRKKEYPIISRIDSLLISPTLGMRDPLTARCTKDKRGNKIRREYFSCNIVQIKLSDLIFSEYEEL